MKERWYLILVMLIVFVSDDTLLFGTNANPLFEYIKYACYVISTLYLLFNMQRSKEMTSRVMLMCIFVLLSSFYNNDLRMGLLYKITLLVFSASFAQLISFKRFTELFCKIIYILSVSSIIGVAVAFILPSLLSYGLPVANKADTTFSSFLLFSMPLGFDSIRNYGIFREPGVYQMYLILALFFELCVNEVFSLKRIISYIIALILTFSTTGFIALGMTLILFQFSSNKSRISSRNKMLITGFVLVGILYLSLSTNLLSSEGIIFDKFSNSERHTTIARMSSITSNIEMWKLNPILGLGLQKVNDMFVQLSFKDYGFASEHNTNTFLCELATFGIFYFIIFIGGVYYFCKYITRKKIEFFLIMAILIVLAAGEKLTFSPFFYILLFYGYKMRYSAINNYCETANSKII